MDDKIKSPNEIAQNLLDQHVQHEMALFEDESLLNWFRDESNNIFNWLREVKLNQVVSSTHIKEVIRKNAVERQIPGAVAEVAGEASYALFSSELQKKTQVKDVFSYAQYEEFVDKLLEMHEQRNNGLGVIIDLPIYKELISDVIYQAIIRYIYDTNVLSKSVPGVSSILKMGRKAVHKTVPKLEGAVEENVKNYIAGNLSYLLRESKSFLADSLTDEQLKESALELWDIIDTRTLNEFQKGMDNLDLSDFIVLGYEFWLSFRQSDYFRHCYELIVDYFFERYGDSKLGLLFDDFMFTPDQLMDEAQRFAPHLLVTLRESGQLEGLIRRRLEGFYFSKSTNRYFSELTKS